MPLRPVDSALLHRGHTNDPRLGALVVDPDVDFDVVLLGGADDTGVSNSGGRAGAALGPTEIRRWLYLLTPGLDGALAGLRIADLGDVTPGASLADTHGELERTIAEVAARAPVVFLGGGHDLAFASHSGVLSVHPGPAALLNIDAHLDVRALRDGAVTSGTPFRRLLERWGGRIASFVELGLQPQHNASEHADWARDQGARLVSLDELRAPPGAAERLKRELAAAAASAEHVLLSLDLDAFAAAVAPGVSAPPADGFWPEEVLPLLEAAGRSPRVRLLDVMELSPPHDENGRTARLAALCVWRFLRGLAQR